MAFDSERGVHLLLQRLAASPLVRKTLPNAAAICTQYFAFKRNPHESMSNFLVRETLVHEEFSEAIIRLHEEKVGVSQETRDYGLPPTTGREAEWSWWEDDEGWRDEDYDAGEEGPAGEGDQPQGDGRPEPEGATPGGQPAATGSSPSRRDGGGSQVGSIAPEEEPKPAKAIDELSIADSFIMEVLRGWRLLQAAGLNAEEKRDILSTTRNSLEYGTVAAALQGLWDEQLLGYRHQGSGSGSGFHANYVDHQEADELFYQDAWWDDGWWDDGGYGYYTGIDDGWWEGEWEAPGESALQGLAAESPDDNPAIKEAAQAEQVAEALALEATRTWTEAQRATQALRKDRGFGAAGPGVAAKCYNCGASGHMARDCPDRRHPSFTKGLGRGKGYCKGGYHIDVDEHYINYMKGKGKGKTKKGMWMETNALWAKGKNKGKGKDPYRTVNAYASEYFLGGLEVTNVLDAASTTTAGTEPHCGMIDCGATASAAPEAVVKGLIDAVLTRDKSAKIEFDQSARPYFRFGNGRWGRALCRVRIESRASGKPQEFALYTLPNPAEYYQNDLDKSSLVPVLIGMDYLGKTGVGMMIDFTTGLAMNTRDPEPEIYQLSTNRKGHYVLDIVQHLTKGCVCSDGQAHVVIHASHPKEDPHVETQCLELGTLWLDMTACDRELDEQELSVARSRMWSLYQRAQGRESSAASAAMCGLPAVPAPPTTSSSCSLGHVAPLAADDRADLRGRDQIQDAKGEGAAPRSQSPGARRRERSSSLQQSVAVLQPPHCGHPEVESPRPMDPLCHMRPTTGVSSSRRVSWAISGGKEPRDGAEDAAGARTLDEGSQTIGRHMQGHAEEDRCRGAAEALDSAAQGHDLEGHASDSIDGGIANTAYGTGNDELSQQYFQRQLADGPERPGPQCSVRAGNGSVKAKDMPLYMGKKVMKMVAMMTALTAGMLMNLHLGDRDGLWEIACAPHSWLSESATEHGLNPRRINLQAGYDLYKKETWERLRELRLQRRPKRLWISLPCTKWCSWTSLNYAHRPEELEAARRKERRMLWEVNKFLKEALYDDPGLLIYFEWPHPCFGWKQRPLEDLAEFMDQQAIPWLHCRIDGCNYGLRCEDESAFILKKWLVKTTDEQFHRVFRAKVCPGNHQHTRIEGNESARSSYYPWRLCQAITRHWRDQTVPPRHLHMLAQRKDEEEMDASDDLRDEEMDAGGAVLEAIQVVEELARDLLQRQDFSRKACERLLLQMPTRGGTIGHARQKGIQGGVSAHMYGSYVYGGFSGVTNHSQRYPAATKYLNQFLRQHIPHGTWTSLMVSYNTRALPHRDLNNARNSNNYLVCLGSYDGGGLWLRGPDQCGKTPNRRRGSDGTMWYGHVRETRDQVVEFSPHVWHATESWSGYRIAVAAFTTRTTTPLEKADIDTLQKLGFPLPQLSSAIWCHAATQATDTEVEDQPLPDGVTKDEYQNWESKVAKFHRAAGHPTNRNLAKIIADAGHESWKISVAKNHKCPACASLRPGGTSSGQIPPAATREQYKAWEAVAVDGGEWIPPGRKVKVKFLLFTDVATKLRMVQPLCSYSLLEMRAETGADFMKAFAERWLGMFPKPRVVLLDAAKSFISAQVHEFLSNLNILVHHVAEKEAWAHGVAEASVQDVKHTSSAISLDNLELDPMIVMQLATSALNSTEYTAGYSAYQWAFGTNYSVSDEDLRTYEAIDRKTEYVQLVSARQRAEEIARRTRAHRVLTKLANTTSRQPLRNYAPMDLVKVWRRVWPQEQYKGPRGGFKKSGRPHWVGPGRVVFSEILPHQHADDDRRHIVWVLVGSQLLRCSIHAVRPATEVERFQFETSGIEDPTTWKSLADIMPKREYFDLTDQVPQEADVEVPDLPPHPDESTSVVPKRRAIGKVTFRAGDYVQRPVRERLHREGGVDDAGDEDRAPTTDPSVPASSSTTTPATDPSVPASSSTTTSAATKHSTDVNDYDLPDKKKQRQSEPTWVDDLYAEEQNEENTYDLYAALDDTEEFMRIEFDVGGDMSHRQQKQLQRNPVAYMVKKMRDSEVVLSKLPAHERPLFSRAKAKEVDSFIKNEAVRKCLNKDEIKQAYDSQRIVKARWVLTWKLVPPEDRAEALQDSQQNSETLHSRDGSRKAKARIVLLGFQHPSLLDPTFKTASPVQSTLGRNLLYTMAAHHQWMLEGLDLATAFLQTKPTEADQELWTTGVEELREALDVGSEGIMRILRNIYGSTTAPRGLWLSLHKKLTELGGQAVLGERCLWIWLSKTVMDGNHPKVIGAMGGHVDDFHRIGDDSDEWKAVKESVDKAYKWGMAKRGAYRHAGTDVSTVKDEHGYDQIVVDQAYYIETLQDVAIETDRLRSGEALQKRDVDACRAALGALQWLAIQSQPQLCARCNLLLTELVTNGTMETAREIQQMIGEVRQESFKLVFRKFPQARHWSELVFISMGDQAHNNRPKGDSTGGMVTLVAGPESVDGQVTVMSLLAWRTWKLRRKAIGSNDAEVQSILEAEDQNFRTRLLWTELHGAAGRDEQRALRRDLVNVVEDQILQVKGILCTDSRGGYDAVEVNESPLLGLSNMRAALQAFQLRDNLRRAGCELRWLASDYDLADALTKRKLEARLGLLKFLRSGHWSIRFDPSFTSAKKGKKQGRCAIDTVDQHLRNGPDISALEVLLNVFGGDATCMLEE